MGCSIGAVCLGVVLMPQVLRADATAPSLSPGQEPQAAMVPSEEDPSAADVPSPVSMEFKDASLKDVLRLFSQQTGINVIATKEVQDQPVTVYLEDVTALDALDQILKAAGLVYERPLGSDIYIVKPRPGGVADGTPLQQTRVYRLRFARLSSSRLAKAAATAVSASGGGTGGTTGGGQSSSSTTGGSTGGATSFTSGSGGAAGGGAGAQVGVDLAIKPLLTKDGSLIVDERTNSLIITEMPENFPRLETVLNALDIKTAQLLIEAEVLETTLAKLKDLGVEWGTGSSGTLFQLTPAKHSTRFPFGDFFGGRHGFLAHRGAADADTALTSAQLGTLDASQAVAVLQALETDTNTKVLARPKVLTLDNESAIIQLSTDQAIGFQSTTGEQTATTTATPERTTTGVILTVTPQVNKDGFVTMLVEPSVTKVEASKIQPPTKVGGTVVDPKTRSARALVRIRQGETLVMGGLIDRSEQAVLKQVPGLSAIPVLGEVFKNRQVDNSTSELVVFVTPRIVAEPPETRTASAELSPTPRSLASSAIAGERDAKENPASVMREREQTKSRQEAMEDAMSRLERSSL